MDKESAIGAGIGRRSGWRRWRLGKSCLVIISRRHLTECCRHDEWLGRNRRRWHSRRYCNPQSCALGLWHRSPLSRI